MTHDEMVCRAGRWLRNFAGCGVVLTELVSNTSTGEIPDAIGWRASISIMVECKTSRADFIADRFKRFRRLPEMGVGRHRYFLCPAGLISPEEIPAGWGLLYVEGRRIRVVAGNSANSTWYTVPFEKVNERAEIVLLTSALRRIQEAPMAARIVKAAIPVSAQT